MCGFNWALSIWDDRGGILQALSGEVCGSANAGAFACRFWSKGEVLDTIPTWGIKGHTTTFLFRFPVEGLLPYGVQVLAFQFLWINLRWCVVSLIHAWQYCILCCWITCRHLRKLFSVDPADYMIAICGNDALRELSSPGKSGSFFYLTQDDRFMIKTVKKSEVKVFFPLYAVGMKLLYLWNLINWYGCYVLWLFELQRYFTVAFAFLISTFCFWYHPSSYCVW